MVILKKLIIYYIIHILLLDIHHSPELEVVTATPTQIIARVLAVVRSCMDLTLKVIVGMKKCFGTVWLF